MNNCSAIRCYNRVCHSVTLYDDCEKSVSFFFFSIYIFLIRTHELL